MAKAIRKQTSATGPAAYHARLEQEQIATLQARVAELEARLVGWTAPFAFGEAQKRAAADGYTVGHKDGYRAGWSDAKLGVMMHQYPEAA